MVIPNEPRFAEPSVGPASPAMWYGTATVAGALNPWARAPVGSEYTKVVANTSAVKYLKIANAGADADWKAVTTAA